MTAEERHLAKQCYLNALADSNSGITLETPAGLIEGTVQRRWGQAAQEGSEATRTMTHSQILDQARQNSGWYETHPPKPSPRKLPKS